LDQVFDIDADTGAIVTGKGLDRETAGWHNITVLAMEAGEPGGGANMEGRGDGQRVGLWAGQSPGRTGRRLGAGQKETAELRWGRGRQRLTHRITDVGRIPSQKGRAQA